MATLFGWSSKMWSGSDYVLASWLVASLGNEHKVHRLNQVPFLNPWFFIPAPESQSNSTVSISKVSYKSRCAEWKTNFWTPCPWDNDSWGLQGCQGDMMNKECHLDENSGPHSTWDSPKQSWTSHECYSSFFEVFPKFLRDPKWNLWKWNFTEELVVAWTYLIGFWNMSSALHLCKETCATTEKGKLRHWTGKQGSTIVETGKLSLRPGQILNIHLVTNEAGSRISTVNINTTIPYL